MKFAFVSHTLPPNHSGQAMVISRLLRDISPEEYCMISSDLFPSKDKEFSRELPGKLYKLKHCLQINRGYRWGLAEIRQYINATIGDTAVFVRAREIAAIVIKEKCQVIVACSGDIVDLPASYYASKIVGCAFVPYYFDDYSTQWTMKKARNFAGHYEKIFIEDATSIIVPNEFMGKVLKERYGVTAEVIHNICDLSAYENPIIRRTFGETINIVYTGSIYFAHYDSLRNLLAAIASIQTHKMQLHLYSIAQQHELTAAGIVGPVELHSHVDNSQMPDIQQNADILFLPLAFNAGSSGIINTSAPGKMGEYMASGRPIIVHAPPESFVCWYFRKYECGIVVDKDDPACLATQILALINDEALCEKICNNARQRAQIDFSIESAQQKFAHIMESL